MNSQMFWAGDLSCAAISSSGAVHAIADCQGFCATLDHTDSEVKLLPCADETSASVVCHRETGCPVPKAMTSLDPVHSGLFLAQYALTDDGCEINDARGTRAPNYWLAEDDATNARLRLDLGCPSRFSAVVLKNTYNSGLNDRLKRYCTFS